MTDTTEDRLAKALEEQNRLLQKGDRRGGCLWNLIMVIFFGVFYLAWLAGKRLVKWTIAAARLTWAFIRWCAVTTWHGLQWAGRQVRRPFEARHAD